MTILGIDTTTNEPVTDWTAIHPNPRRSPRLMEAKENMEAAWASYDKLVDDCEVYQGTKTLILGALSLAEDAEKLYWKIWNEENGGNDE